MERESEKPINDVTGDEERNREKKKGENETIMLFSMKNTLKKYRLRKVGIFIIIQDGVVAKRFFTLSLFYVFNQSRLFLSFSRNIFGTEEHFPK